jgi:hypothetical protein
MTGALTEAAISLACDRRVFVVEGNDLERLRGEK